MTWTWAKMNSNFIWVDLTLEKNDLVFSLSLVIWKRTFHSWCLFFTYCCVVEVKFNNKQSVNLFIYTLLWQVEQVLQLQALAEAQLEFHRQSTEVLENLLSTLNDRYVQIIRWYSIHSYIKATLHPKETNSMTLHEPILEHQKSCHFCLISSNRIPPPLSIFWKVLILDHHSTL